MNHNRKAWVHAPASVPSPPRKTHLQTLREHAKNHPNDRNPMLDAIRKAMRGEEE